MSANCFSFLETVPPGPLLGLPIGKLPSQTPRTTALKWKFLAPTLHSRLCLDR